MAQAVRHDKVELESLLSQAKEKALLRKDNPGQKANGKAPAPLLQKVGNQGDEKAREAYLHANELTYANRSSWNFIQGRAELKESKVLQVDGEYSTEKLEGGSYDVYFELMLSNDFNISSPVEFTLTLSNGSVQKHKENLMNYPTNKKIWIKAGNFFNKDNFGDINFAMSGTESTTSKKGLVVYGVLINM